MLGAKARSARLSNAARTMATEQSRQKCPRDCTKYEYFLAAPGV